MHRSIFTSTLATLLMIALLVTGISVVGAAPDHPQTQAAALGGTTCGNAPLITSLPFNDSGDTNAGTQNNVNSYPTLPINSYDGNEIVYAFVADVGASIDITVTGVSGTTDMMVGVGTGCSNAEMFANSQDAIDDNSPEIVPTITGLTPGTTYYIVIDHYSADPGYPKYGPYSISVTGTGIITPPAGDDDDDDVAVEPVPGCDVTINIPSGSVGAKITADAPVYWMPGAMTEHVLPAGTSVIAIGPDASGAYFKIVYVCDYLWVPSGSIGPNPENPWNGTPLPGTPVN